MARVSIAVVGTATLLFALAAGAARAPDANRFTAMIAPSAVQPLSTGSYAVQILNRRTSDTTANNAHVVLRAEHLLDPVPGDRVGVLRG